MTKIAAMQHGWIEKEEVESPVYHKVAAPYFFIIMYIVQLYKEDWTIFRMLGCQTVALPSTEQIVTYLRIFV